MRRRALTWVLSAAVGLAACAMVRVDEGTPPPAQATPTVTTDPARAATALSATSACSETELRKPLATLRWTAASQRGSEQRVDVTTRPDGFASGGYRSSDAIPADATSLVWDAVEAGINHYWRVVTVYPGIAVASEVATFKGAVCVADYQPSQSPRGVASPTPPPAQGTLVPAPGSPAPSTVVVAPATAAPPAATDAPSGTLVAAAPSLPARVDSASGYGWDAALLGTLVLIAALAGATLWWLLRRPA